MINLLKKLSLYQQTVLYSTLFVAGILLNFLSSSFLFQQYPDRPLVPDLLFDLTPSISSWQYLSDPLVVISGILFLWLLWKQRNHHFLNISLLGFALIHWMRALIIPLTPLGRHLTNNQPYGVFGVTQHGMFPSGHTAAAFLLFLLTPSKYKKTKITFFLLFIAQTIILIISRGHYSIDIIGGMMVAYIANDWIQKSINQPQKSQ